MTGLPPAGVQSTAGHLASTFLIFTLKFLLKKMDLFIASLIRGEFDLNDYNVFYGGESVVLAAFF